MSKENKRNTREGKNEKTEILIDGKIERKDDIRI
jgi:hypothetical protein